MTEPPASGALPPDDPMPNGVVVPAHGTAVQTAFDVMRRRLTLLETRCRGLELRVRELEADR